MSKLSFRAKALDAGKPMPIYMVDELPDLPDYSAINRAVPQMPSGMTKEEECEHHLQRAICTGLIIPTPEVSDIQDEEVHKKLYPANYKQPRQLIHMQPFAMEHDITDYDMDSEDERWLEQQAARQRLELAPLKFEEMMDRLEKNSGQTVVSISDAKALLKEDDDLIIAVFDYWLNKRLKMQHPLILAVKTEHRSGTAANNPYLAFRRRTEKMQTRKNRKNGEASYEKMLKLRRDLSRAVTLLELVKRREKTKREVVLLTLEVVEKRYAARDFSGAIAAEAAAAACAQLLQQRTGSSVGRPAFQPLFHNHHHHYAQQSQQSPHNHLHHASGAQAGGSGANKAILKDEAICRKERRQYKKRKHKAGGSSRNVVLGSDLLGGGLSSDEDAVHSHRTAANVQSPEPLEEDDGPFAFRRNNLCSYHEALPSICGNWPWQQPSPTYPHLQDDVNSKPTPLPPLSPGGSIADIIPLDDNATDKQRLHSQPDKRYRYTLTSVTARSDGDDDDDTAEVNLWRKRHKRRRCIGFARRRLGRGGRVILDRVCAPGHPAGLASDEFWSSLNYTIYGSAPAPQQLAAIKREPADSNSATAVSDSRPQETHHSYSTNLLINSAAGELRRLSACSSSADTLTNSRRTSVTLNSGCAVDTSIVKVEPVDGGDSVDGASVVDNNVGAGGVVEVSRAMASVDKKSGEDEMEMVEFLQQVQRDWLHFRPKTPPLDYTPPCYLLPPLSPPPAFFSSDLPFTLELRPIANHHTPFYPYTDDDEMPGILLDESPFITEPFAPPSSITDDDLFAMGIPGDLEGVSRDVPTAGDSGVWSMEMGGEDADRKCWKVTEEREEEEETNEPICTDLQSEQLSSLHTDSITLNNTKPCANDEYTDNNTIGSSTFTIRDINPTRQRKTLSTLIDAKNTDRIDAKSATFKQEQTIVRADEKPILQTKPISSFSSTLPFSNTLFKFSASTTQTNRVPINNIQQRLQIQQQTVPQTTTTTTTSGASIGKRQLQQHCVGVRGLVTSLPQQGGNGSRTGGWLWRGDHHHHHHHHHSASVVKGGDAPLVQSNGMFNNTLLDLQDVSSSVKPKNNRHHTFVSGVLEGNISNANAINIHGAHSLTLNSHSANNSTSAILDHAHMAPNSLTTTVSVSDSPVLPHPKVGVGGTVTAAPLTSSSTSSSNASSGPVPGTAKATSAIVQQRKNNQLVMEVT